MRIRSTWILALAVCMAALGCAHPITHHRHNLPPAIQLMEPGPGVGGQGQPGPVLGLKHWLVPPPACWRP